MLKIIKDTIDIFFGESNRPYLAKILYLIDGIIILCSVLFQCTNIVICLTKVKYLDWINYIMLKQFISDNDVLVLFSLWLIIASFLYKISKNNIVIKLLEKEIIDLLALVYTIGDILDLFTAVIVTFLYMSVFIQYLKTGVLYLSIKSIVIYIFIIINYLDILITRYYYKNLKICKKS